MGVLVLFVIALSWLAAAIGILARLPSWLRGFADIAFQSADSPHLGTDSIQTGMAYGQGEIDAANHVVFPHLADLTSDHVGAYTAGHEAAEHVNAGLDLQHLAAPPDNNQHYDVP